jgi:hypothetical protein
MVHGLLMPGEIERFVGFGRDDAGLTLAGDWSVASHPSTLSGSP